MTSDPRLVCFAKHKRLSILTTCQGHKLFILGSRLRSGFLDGQSINITRKEGRKEERQSFIQLPSPSGRKEGRMEGRKKGHPSYSCLLLQEGRTKGKQSFIQLPSPSCLHAAEALYATGTFMLRNPQLQKTALAKLCTSCTNTEDSLGSVSFQRQLLQLQSWAHLRNVGFSINTE